LRISEWIIYTEFEFGIANLESYSDDPRFFQNQSFPAFCAVFYEYSAYSLKFVHIKFLSRGKIVSREPEF